MTNSGSQNHAGWGIIYMQKLIYAAPAEDVRDIISAYYFADFSYANMPEGGVVAHERAAIAQVRFILSGTALVVGPTSSTFFVSGPVIAGPTTGKTSYHILSDIRMVGGGLLPCGWHAMIRRSAADYLNKVIAIDEQFAKPLHDLVAQIGDAQDFDTMVRLLDAGARELNQYVDPEVRKFVHIVDNWLISSIAPEVCTLYDAISLSRRQVERLVKHLYGVPPKMLARKYRALRTARLLHARNATAEEYAHAFYDQSHMIREIKQFTGLTPKEISLDTEGLSRVLDTRGDLAGQVHPLTALT